MRLKTKIILICCISILASSIFCNVSIYHSLKRSSLEAAEGQSFEDASTTFYNLEKKMRLVQINGAEIDKNVLEYIIKQQNDELLVCFLIHRRKMQKFLILLYLESQILKH